MRLKGGIILLGTGVTFCGMMLGLFLAVAVTQDMCGSLVLAKRTACISNVQKLTTWSYYSAGIGMSTVLTGLYALYTARGESENNG